MLEMMIKTTFATVSMMPSPQQKFRKSKNVQNKLQFQRVSKRFKSDIHCVRNVGNDD